MPALRVTSTISSLFLVTCLSSSAHAQYAIAPDEAARDEPVPDLLEQPVGLGDSVARLGVGPALRLSDGAAFAGLGASLDLGQASGLRLQGAWTDVGGDGGEQHYGADLWLFLGPLGRLQPYVGAGAALVRAETPAGFHDLGVATVRATLDFVLPIAHSDARLGVDALLNVPAIDTRGRAPSALFVSRLGLGL